MNKLSSKLGHCILILKGMLLRNS